MTRLDPTTYWKAAADAFAEDALELTLLPTEQCNLRCAYCYERFEHGRMAPAVIAGVKRLIARRAPGLRRLKLDWFGGEPLTAADVIEEISAVAAEAAAANPFLEYGGSATTNGVLLSERLARRLSAVGLTNIHVSLDGPAETHDVTRRAAGGQPTFARIMRNLRAIRDSDVALTIDLRVHVTRANVSLLDAFADALAEEFLGDPRFSVYFFPIVDLGGPNQGAFDVLSGATAAEAVARLTARVAARVAARRDEAAPSPAAGRAAGAAGGAPVSNAKACGAAYVCYAAKGNAWVVRANGRLAKCTVGFEDPRNDVGRITEDGALEIERRAVTPWLRGWTTGERMALHCPFEGMREDVAQGRVAARG